MNPREWTPSTPAEGNSPDARIPKATVVNRFTPEHSQVTGSMSPPRAFDPILAAGWRMAVEPPPVEAIR
jgi:hypothetical protein